MCSKMETRSDAVKADLTLALLSAVCDSIAGDGGSPRQSTIEDQVDLSTIVPLPDGEHLRYGLSLDAMKQFVRDRLDFPHSYYRNESELGWVTSIFGPVKEEPVADWRGLDRNRNLTGYDLVACIRAWLQSKNAAHLSVCEVLAAEDWQYAEENLVGEKTGRRLRAVQTSNVFYSHMQSPCAVSVLFQNIWLACHMHENDVPGDPTVWVDYFVLRQCQPDFDVSVIRAVIHEIGCTIVELDRTMQYLTRSFCIFEVFCGAEIAELKLLILTEMDTGAMAKALARKPVSSKEACTSRAQDKQQIDDFIRAHLGFLEFDRIVTAALMQGAQTWEDLEEAPPTDDWSPVRSDVARKPLVHGAHPTKAVPQKGGQTADGRTLSADECTSIPLPASTPIAKKHVVLSTQYLDKPYYQPHVATSALQTDAAFAVFPFALALKQLLEGAGFTVYNPNTDNTRGDAHWDLSFKENLDLAVRSGGFMLSLRDAAYVSKSSLPWFDGLEANVVSGWQWEEVKMAEERGLAVEIFENHHSMLRSQLLEQQVDNFISLSRTRFYQYYQDTLSKYGHMYSSGPDMAFAQRSEGSKLEREDTAFKDLSTPVAETLKRAELQALDGQLHEKGDELKRREAELANCEATVRMMPTVDTGTDHMPLPADSHLRLGISLPAIEEFLHRIGWDPEDGPGAAYIRSDRLPDGLNGAHGGGDELHFVTEACGPYDPAAAQVWKDMRQRNRKRCDAESRILWDRAMGADHDRARELIAQRKLHGDSISLQEALVEIMGVQEQWSRMEDLYGHQDEAWSSRENPSPLTGYDFAAAVRHWLRSQGKAQMSVCEVLLEEGCVGVGPANTFYSHMQQPCVTACIASMRAANLTFPKLHGKENETYYWLDYLTLRQCRQDFNLPHIASAVGAAGLTLAEVDLAPDPSYLQRSFCIFEVYATVAAQNELLVHVHVSRGEKSLDEVLDETPVDCMRAQTRDVVEKHKIDMYIEREIGAEELNAVVTKAMREGQNRLRISRG